MGLWKDKIHYQKRGTIMPIRQGLELSDADAIEYDRLVELASYYDRLQYTMKIKLNSLYGALTNFYFRFFDLRLGQSTTGTGRAILDHMCSQTALILDGKYDMFSESIAYGDSVAAKSSIFTSKGRVNIEDLYGTTDVYFTTMGSNDKEYCYPNQLKVLTFDPKTEQLCFRDVRYVMRHKVQKQMYQITTCYGDTVVVTEDHSLMVLDSNSVLTEATPADCIANESIGMRCDFDGTSIFNTTITKITPVEYDGYVYDIEVDDTHTFFANDVLVHNTDSVYFKTNAEYGSDGMSTEEINLRAIAIADKIGELADASFPEFCKKAFCIQPEYENIIKCDREVVAKRGIFVSKKRYVLKLVDLDGYRCDKLKAMGLEMKKTTTPKIIQKFLEDVINLILNGETEWDDIDNFIVDYRDQVKTALPVIDIGLPKGVKKVEFYTAQHIAGVNDKGEKPRLPGHVAASIHYNECLKHFNDTDSQPIKTGSKIKVFYLTEKYGKFKSIAIPTEAKHLPTWFSDYCEVDREIHEQKLIDNNLEKIFTAIGRDVPDAQSQFNDSLIEW